MAIAKVDNLGNVIKYPYEVADRIADYPNTSFPADWWKTSDYPFEEVQEVPTPTDVGTFDYVEDIPERVGGILRKKWIQKALTGQERTDRIQWYRNKMRRKRNLMLIETDWIVVQAKEKDLAIPVEWLAYRQALRDLDFTNPFNITWPDPPSATEYL